MKCFVLEKKFVSGPFASEELKELIKDGKIQMTSQIWWRGQDEWMNAKAWLNFKPDTSNNVVKMRKEANWFIEKEAKTYGPLSRAELVAHLRDSKNLSNVKVWKRGQKSRATIYQYNDLTDALGIVQRKTPRAPIVGDINVTTERGIQTAKLCSISQGGLGMTNIDEVFQGEKLQLEIDSPLLADKIICEGIVRYKAPTGRIGIQFDSINSEAVSNIVDYINQFVKPELNKKTA